MNFIYPRLGMLTPQFRALGSPQALLPRFAVNEEECVHAHHHLHRFGVLRIDLHCIDKLPACMSPTAHMDKLRPTHALIDLVAVSLQDAFPIAEEFERTITSSSETKVEYRLAAGFAVVP